LVADLWGALKDLPEHKSLFPDIDELTTFPDYRVPQILNQLSVLEYSEELNELIGKKQEIKAGSQMEL
jgi:Potential Queuosine, Q, salvage protein family